MAHASTGQTVTISLALNEAVVVSGKPFLQLNDGAIATYETGSGSSTLRFSYIVQGSEHTSDLRVTGISLPIGSDVRDFFGNVLSSVTGDLGLQINGISVAAVQNDYFAITRTTLPLNQATLVADAISSGTQTESAYVNSLFSLVGNTTIPAVAVAGSMYNAVGTSNEITLLATQFLPPQVANATSHGFNPQVYASEALGLAFAFNDENGNAKFANNFGPSHVGMPGTVAGDAAFAAAASIAIFETASTTNLVNAVQGYVANWKAFFTANGLPGIAHPSADQIDLAARGAAWGDAVGVALANNLGPITGQVSNFLLDAAQGTAVYSASLGSQPVHGQFPSVPPFPANEAIAVVGVSQPLDFELI